MRNFFFFFLILFVISNGICQEEDFRFLALGDSYTAGTGELPKNSWPVQFVSSLKKKGISVTESLIVAKAGWTTTDLLKHLKKQKPNTDFDLVSLLIGVNNQYRGTDMAVFKKEFPQLLEMSIGFAGNDVKQVFVLSIPDWSVTPFAKFKAKNSIVTEINAYNAFIKKEAEKRGVPFIGITKISRNAEVNSALIASDSLHPSKRMYKLWVKKIQKKILK